MNRSSPGIAAAFAALVLFVGGAARAQEQAAPATPPPSTETGAARAPEAPTKNAPAPSPPSSEPGARVHSSHTVDVIAPGEKVDTIFGRMRMERPAPPPRGDAVRPPPGTESRDNKPSPGPGRSGGGHPPPGGDGRARPPSSPRTDGAPPPPSSQPPPPSPNQPRR
ncbi:hypothetical protein [Pyxidicoccus sp. MSG2]|uniref:hypothetical protein n=1 Tax=Pyxidicoccus sp. MSG2 TaxID=2996790 RepID=UPI00226E0AC5|nr:hypothetical protein [Pyxidicoccus sp. MSG2]MCY1020167.1 hypothetical protein [Pyxidicoccus sp. MSG2]